MLKNSESRINIQGEAAAKKGDSNCMLVFIRELGRGREERGYADSLHCTFI